MKKIVVFAIVLCAVAALPLFAQSSSRAGNATLVSWTVDKVENGMKDKVSNVAIQPSGNDMQYTLQVKDGTPVSFKYNRVSKRLHQTENGELVYSTDTASLGEAGANSTLTFTDKDGAVNVLKFRKK
ncbi:hypothetical protein AGMMS50293_14240 [Spirochaetia bacterium]|nr:hypothetical protein AGMMS50293_14240 [Spirochaetia bacterium]